MSVSGKYAKLDIPKIGKDEPVFIFRAKDKLAAPVIEMCRVPVVSYRSPLTRELEKEIRAFRRWKGPKKIPD
jgi:hypothetical protein